ncbi:hypothetical protein [Daejeonella sp.]
MKGKPLMNLNLPFIATSWPGVCNYDADIVLVYAIFKYALLHLRH